MKLKKKNVVVFFMFLALLSLSIEAWCKPIQINGCVVRVEPQKSTVTVMTNKSGTMIFVINPQTMLLRNGEKVALWDIKSGVSAKVEYEIKKDKVVVNSITFGGKPPAAAVPAKKK